MKSFIRELGVKNVLLVTDDPWIRDSLSMFFAIEGCRLHTASRANEAIAAVSADRFDLILCEYWLPDMDGLSFLKLYGKHQRAAAVILISAYLTYQDIEEARRAGVHDVIGRPFSVETLERSLRRHASRARGRIFAGPGKRQGPTEEPAPRTHDRPQRWRSRYSA